MVLNTSLLLIFEIIYALLTFMVCMRIVYDTRSISKTLAYLLLAIFVPVFGIVFYFSFGINYRKRKIYSRKSLSDEQFKDTLIQQSYKENAHLLSPNHRFIIEKNSSLIRLLSAKSNENQMVFMNNHLEVIENGEQLFPAMIESIRTAKHHIHLEFYIVENDSIGNLIKDELIKKAKEGIEVRFIYDDFGSRSIRKNIVKELIDNGVQTYPFNKIRLIRLANRLNYRNHRKILIVDGQVSYIGGINLSERYDNQFEAKNGGYWRDIHLKIDGQTTSALQEIFIADWNFCSEETLVATTDYFPYIPVNTERSKLVQIVSSGPDSDVPSILYAILHAISKAEKEIILTTPYYIPENSLQEMLVIAALSGIEVKLIVPKKGDATIVSYASESYFYELLKAGVRIFQYEKGMLHAKTFVIDRQIASIGSANLDLRSFDLNFEVSSIIYDEDIALELAEIFEKDCLDATEITFKNWKKRSRWKKTIEKIMRLISPFL